MSHEKLGVEIVCLSLPLAAPNRDIAKVSRRTRLVNPEDKAFLYTNRFTLLVIVDVITL